MDCIVRLFVLLAFLNIHTFPIKHTQRRTLPIVRHEHYTNITEVIHPQAEEVSTYRGVYRPSDTPGEPLKRHGGWFSGESKICIQHDIEYTYNNPPLILKI